MENLYLQSNNILPSKIVVDYQCKVPENVPEPVSTVLHILWSV